LGEDSRLPYLPWFNPSERSYDACSVEPENIDFRERRERKEEIIMNSDVDHNNSHLPCKHGASVAAARGFGQIFGLHPAMAFLTLAVDSMLFGGEVISLGTSIIFSAAVGGVLAVITFMAQKKWYGDDDESACIKALILGFLTAIPTPLPAMIYVPSGLVGLVHSFRRK
jgi:hypothetical protein